MPGIMQVVFVSFTAVVLTCGIVGCAQNVADERVDRAEGEEMSDRTIEEVLEEHTPEWMAVEGVVGTALGLCDDRPCIKIYVVEKTEELEAQFPETVEGHPLILQETGEIRAF